MRTLLLVLALAACGGGKGPTTTTPTAPVQTEEDWRGYLSLIVGTWTFSGDTGTFTQTCRWIADSTFVLCKDPQADDTIIIGWEPHNRRYVHWTIDKAGNTQVLTGALAGAMWTFEGENRRITLSRESPTKWSMISEAPMSGTTLTGTYTTSTPPPAPPADKPDAPITKTDWRSSLEPFVAEWTFEGTSGGNPMTYAETCRWITGATFVVCKAATLPGFEMLGWEVNNQRFVHYAVKPTGEVDVHVGTLAGKVWTFVNAKERVTMNHESGIRMTIRGEEKAADGTWQPKFEGAYSTDPGSSSP